MVVKITLEFDDYLTYHLFLASRSDALKKRRLIHWVSVPLLYIVTGIAFVYLNGSEIVRTIFFVTAGIWFLFYPFYSKWAIRRFLLRQVTAKYASLVGQEGVLEIREKNIIVKGKDSSMNLNYSDIKEIIELPEHFLVDLKVGTSLILPKKKIEADTLDEVIKKISHKTDLQPTVQVVWGWK